MGAFSFLRRSRTSTGQKAGKEILVSSEISPESVNKKSDSKELFSSKPTPEGANKDGAPAPEVKAIEPPNFSSAHQCITVKVGSGKEKKSFMIHKEFACYHSPVVRAAFNSTSNFIESQTNTYEMKDIDAGTMQLLLQWLYTQEVGLKPLVVESEGARERFLLLHTFALKLWYLGDRLIIPKLQNDLADYIWTLNATGKWVPGLAPSGYAEESAYVPQEMLLDLVQHFKEHGNGYISNTPNGTREKFHVKETTV